MNGSAYDALIAGSTRAGSARPRSRRRSAGFEIETPSWGYGDSGTRFGVFPQPGRPRDVFERIADAAEVHRLTGTAPAVALHFPWDAVDDYGELAGAIAAAGLRVGAVNPNVFQDPDYRLGLDHQPRSGDPPRRARAPDRVR